MRAADAAVTAPAKTCLRVTRFLAVLFRFMLDFPFVLPSTAQKNGRDLT
jgi:hypothetical protein